MSKPGIKLIKKSGRESPEVISPARSVADPNKWSRAVRSWVAEFQKNASGESPQAFDRLFQATTRRQF